MKILAVCHECSMARMTDASAREVRVADLWEGLDRVYLDVEGDEGYSFECSKGL